MPLKENIARAARPLFARGGRPTVAQIAAAAGISRATFHRVYGSRDELIRELEVLPDPGSRERILAAAIEMVGRTGLDRLSMDELAAAAGVSRASVYRLFPGKAALFGALVRAYSPMETIAATMERLGGRPPEEVMPELARAVAAELKGRLGMVRTMIFEVTRLAPDTSEGVDFALTRGIGVVLGYMVGQMAAGRLRAMHPVLAMQAFVGPLLVHMITRDLAEERLGFDLPLEEAAGELALAWVRAMRPETSS
jgi:AcrR family transcriptional regulator